MRPPSRRLLQGAALILTLASSKAFGQVPEPRHPAPDELPPPGARTKILTYGSGLLLGFYGVSLGASFLWADDPGAEDLAIPFAGPWMKLGQTTLCSDLPQTGKPCSDAGQVIGAIGVTILGLGQAATAIYLLEGAFMKVDRGGSKTSVARFSPYRAVPGRTPLVSDRGLSDGIQAGQIRFWPVPVTTPTLTGLGVVGHF